ncbi:hypothetical protein [Streptomyces sp. NPDC048188]|uniref:hypothetical protein n=1 Tax=Streptomyces sp. NPDC048188 TaxID=3155749 RepID=UPI003432BEC2
MEAFYDAPRQLPADAEGSEMAKLRWEMHRRMLGNGYCARPVETDCHFKSICESYTFFVTTIEFRPTLERQWMRPPRGRWPESRSSADSSADSTAKPLGSLNSPSLHRGCPPPYTSPASA